MLFSILDCHLRLLLLFDLFELLGLLLFLSLETQLFLIESRHVLELLTLLKFALFFFQFFFAQASLLLEFTYAICLALLITLFLARHSLFIATVLALCHLFLPHELAFSPFGLTHGHLSLSLFFLLTLQSGNFVENWLDSNSSLLDELSVGSATGE